MKVLIADDHDLVRETLVAYLENESDITALGAPDLPSAHAMIRTDGPFDLVLLDYSMPGMNGLEGLEQSIALNAQHPVAILSGTAPRAVAEDAVRRGAAGFLPKTLSGTGLVNAVRFMAEGGKYSPAQGASDSSQQASDQLSAHDFTQRQIEILSGLIRGQSNKEIARELDLQEVTVKLHVKTACRKLSAKNRTQAALLAKELGII